MRIALIDDDPVSLYALRHYLPRKCNSNHEYFSINPKSYSEKFGVSAGYFKLFFDLEKLNLDFAVSDFYWDSNFSLDGFLNFLNTEGSAPFDLPMVCISGSEIDYDITSYNNVLDKIETKLGAILIPNLSKIIDAYSETKHGIVVSDEKLLTCNSK